MARSKTQSLLWWAPILWAPPNCWDHRYPIHPDESYSFAHWQTYQHYDCHTPHLCDPSEMSPKPDSLTVIWTVLSSVNNNIAALLSQYPSNATWEKSSFWCFFQMGSQFIHSLLYSEFHFEFRTFTGKFFALYYSYLYVNKISRYFFHYWEKKCMTFYDVKQSWSLSFF